MPDQLVTNTQAKTRLGITDATDDALLVTLIEQVSDWVQEYTLRRFLPEAAATYVVDTGSGSIIPIRRGIRAVTALELATTDQPDAGGAYTAVALADVILRPASIDRKPGWPATAIYIRGTVGRLVSVLNGAKITGDFGFAAVPPAIQGVVLDAVATAYASRTAGTSDVIGAEGAAIFPWAQYFSRGSPQRATLDRYRGGAGIA